MFLILSGGFWKRMRDLCGRRDHENRNPESATIDYIIRIDGLPKDFLEPLSIDYKMTYFCKTCRRPVPEWEIKRAIGCFAHDLERTSTPVAQYNESAFEPYSIPRIKWMNPCMRIWITHNEGYDKFQEIWKYVDYNFVSTPEQRIPPLPKPVGTRREWRIVDASDVPTIILNNGGGEMTTKIESLHTQSKPIDFNKVIKPKKTDDNRSKEFTCECGKTIKGSGPFKRHQQKCLKEN
jgi:hypothetical protein